MQARQARSMIKLASGTRPSGEVWDYKGKSEIVQIFMSHGYNIDYLQFLYVDDDGALVLSEKQGSSIPGDKFNAVTLNHPDEFLTSVSGSSNNGGLTSLTFGTNQGTYGPFGRTHEYNDELDFQMGNHRLFGGFHGTTRDGVVQSIGIYIKPLTSLSDLHSTGAGGEVACCPIVLAKNRPS